MVMTIEVQIVAEGNHYLPVSCTNQCRMSQLNCCETGKTEFAGTRNVPRDIRNLWIHRAQLAPLSVLSPPCWELLVPLVGGGSYNTWKVMIAQNTHYNSPAFP